MGSFKNFDYLWRQPLVSGRLERLLPSGFLSKLSSWYHDMFNAKSLMPMHAMQTPPQVQIETALLENRPAAATHVEEFHARLRRPLLRLEEDRFRLVAAGALLVRSR